MEKQYINVNQKMNKAKIIILVTVLVAGFLYFQFVNSHKNVHIDITYRIDDSLLYLEAKTSLIDEAKVNIKIRNTVNNIFQEKVATVKNGLINIEFDISDFGAGYLEIALLFSVKNNLDSLEFSTLSQIYGLRGEKMIGNQIIKSSDGEYLCFPKISPIPYPDQSTAEEYANLHLQKTLQPLLKKQSKVVKSINNNDPQWRSFNLFFNSKWYALSVSEKGKLIEKMYFLIDSTTTIRGFNDNDDSKQILVNIYDQKKNLIVKCSENYKYQIIE